MMIEIHNNGPFTKTVDWLRHLRNLRISSILDSCGKQGVNALESATPVDSGLAAGSWNYTISQNGSSWTINWTNSDVENGFPVAIMLQYGYGTGTGGYVHGRDYINPAMRPVFDDIAAKVWKAVTSA